MSELEKARRRRFREFMDEYYLTRHVDLLVMENHCSHYETEKKEYIEKHGRPMYFKKWLIQSKGIPR